MAGGGRITAVPEPGGGGRWIVLVGTLMGTIVRPWALPGREGNPDCLRPGPPDTEGLE